MEFHDTQIEGVKVIIPQLSKDMRGGHERYYEAGAFCANGINTVFTDTTDIRSFKGALRGLHFQAVEMRARLVHVICGAVFDAAVDLRASSPTFGKCHCELLREGQPRAVYIPEGFAHGYITLTESSVFSYQSSGRYVEEYSRGILWNDSALSIPWPLDEWGIDEVICTQKDKCWPTLAEYCRTLTQNGGDAAPKDYKDDKGV